MSALSLLMTTTSYRTRGGVFKCDMRYECVIVSIWGVVVRRNEVDDPHRYLDALRKQPQSELLDNLAVQVIAAIVIFWGQVVTLSSMWALGITGEYNLGHGTRSTIEKRTSCFSLLIQLSGSPERMNVSLTLFRNLPRRLLWDPDVTSSHLVPIRYPLRPDVFWFLCHPSRYGTMVPVTRWNHVVLFRLSRIHCCSPLRRVSSSSLSLLK